ncbi:MAG TPA: Gfo/Idh/MocA family oxidoreductase [Verrucomicrobiae bacterium]|nr:Gfo/Idh/MocA family oxidoreductase [Verrucomicrobiae bacterium]
MSKFELTIGLVGAGMFGGEAHLRAYAGVQRAGISPQLSRIGLDGWAREFAPIQFQLVAIATQTRRSAQRACAKFRGWTAHLPRDYFGEKPWRKMLADFPNIDVVAVATPDHLHTPVILDALKAGAHVITEKPMCLEMAEADRLIELSRQKQRLVAVDMHKRFDPDHRHIRSEVLGQIGKPLYGNAYLEEPLELSARAFKWVEHSDPFSYVGSHWADLVQHHYGCKPVSLTAVGQKQRLARQGIDAYDAVQVRVDYDNGLSFTFHNNWITPPDFEGPVNQGHEIVGAHGKFESDQQYRGLRWWAEGRGSRTANTHFIRRVERPDGSSGCVGYGIDSLTAGLAAICRMKFFGASRESLEAIYPTAEQARVVVAIVQAARVVRDLNFKYLKQGKGAPVTARLGREGITLVDPTRAAARSSAVFRRIYSRPI